MTSRPVSIALESRLGEVIPVLDRGFVRVVDYMGNDAAVVQAARVSMGPGVTVQMADSALIRYLMRERHTSPFEMCEIKLHMRLPIFVARQMVRHRTANINEVSARHSELLTDFYTPAPEDWAAQDPVNKQGRQAEPLPDAPRGRVTRCYDDAMIRAAEAYEALLREGVSREQARYTLPVSTYTEWYWKTDLHNLLHFLALRMHPHAQAEIRAYANVIWGLVQAWVPETAAAWVEYVQGASHLSATAAQVIRRRLAGETVTYESSGLNAREWRALAAVFP